MSSIGRRHVVGRACLAPAVAELSGANREACAHVGVSECEDRSLFVDAFRHDELEVAVSVLGDAEISDLACRRIELCQVAAAGLSVEDIHDLHGGLLCCGDGRVTGSAMADDADVLVEIDGIHLGELAGSGDGLEDGHGHRDLDIALNCTSGALLDQHGEGRDQHAVELAGYALGKSVVVRCDQAQLLVLDPLFESDHVFSHVPHLFDGSAALDVEGVQDVLCFGTDGVLIGDIVGDGPHLLPVKLLGVDPHSVVEIGLVDVEVHHAGIRSSDLSQVGVAESPADLSCSAPLVDFFGHIGIATLDDARNNCVALSGALKVRDHLADRAAGVELAQPCRCICIGVIRRLELLYVDQNHRHVHVANGGKHVVRSRIGQKLADDQVDVRRAELVARRLGQLFGRADSAVDDLDRVRNGLLKCLVLALKLRNQRRELGQIRAQRDGENADSCFGIY